MTKQELEKALRESEEKVKTLIEALETAYQECEETHFRVAQQTISSALAKVKRGE